MKRLFLLIAVCMVGMVNALAQSDSNAPAGFTVVPPEESGTGSYVLTFKKAAADGETLHSWNEVVEGGSLEFLRSATSISIITEGDCELSTADVIHIMGGNSIDTDFPLLTTLDMGDAKLDSNDDLVNMKYAKTPAYNNGLIHLTSFVFPKTTTFIHPDMFSGNTTIEEIIMLEPDKATDPHLTIISQQAFQECTNLSNVRIPDGVTEIGENAFEDCAFEAIFLPNTLTKIGGNAFNKCKNLKSVTIPASVTSIGNSAFQKNYSMTDVYVLGNNVTIPNGAFNENETYNFKYEDDGDGIVEYEDWGTNNQEASPHPLRLHVPDTPEAKSNYINPCLQALNDPRMTDEILNNVGGNYNFIAGILEEYGITNYGGFIWDMGKYVVMDGRRYFTDGNNKFNLEGAPVVTNPYGGWRNFMLAAADVEKKVWPDTRLVESRWYSAVFPFEMSYNQVESTFGTNTDVREFTNVCEHTVNGKLTRTVRFNKKPAIPSATSGGRSVDKNKAGYIKAGLPYMIHPGTRVEIIEVDGKQYGRTIAGVNVEEAQAIVDANSNLETVSRPLVFDVTDTSTDGNDYFFRGTFKPQTLPANSFYLGYDPKNPTRWPLAFYVTTTDLAEKWSAFTSIVRKTNNFATDNSNAKSMGIDFTLIIPEENFGITTGIESVSDQKSVNNGVVYNLNGQIIGNQSTSNLSKGIYIVNGKKIVVR